MSVWCAEALPSRDETFYERRYSDRAPRLRVPRESRWAYSVNPVAVDQGRDAWDWAVVAVTLLGALTATIGFAAWALERRRRPEFLVRWWRGDVGDNDALVHWPPELPAELPAGGSMRVRVAILNVGDALADQVLTNFVAPAGLTLSRPNAPGEPPIKSTNAYVGVDSDLRATYFAGSGVINSGDWLLRDYVLSNDSGLGVQTVRVLFDCSCPSLNARGYRWLPSFMADPCREPESVGPWPPPAGSRAPRWVRALPHGRLRRSSGARADIREVNIT